MADGFERPKGRMLLFWGCGAKPGPGQPVVIDFSKLAAGQMPPNLFTSTIPRIRQIRSEERRVGQECVSPRRSRRSSFPYKTNQVHRQHMPVPHTTHYTN